MEVSNRAKERFCKDCNIPIRLFQEPYFSDRIKLFNKSYGTIEKWNRFVAELRKYKCEQDYFEEYNRIKDQTITSIKESEGYQKFNSEDMNKFAINNNLPGKDIFKPTNNGRIFISLDMKKANFSSLRHYDKGIFNNADTWEEFMRQFTKNEHIINSKYIRQVILGNCNPKRQTTYEKYLMNQLLGIITEEFGMLDSDVVFFSNDEIVYDVTEMGLRPSLSIQKQLKQKIKKEFPVPIRTELFTLHKINGTNGYYKNIYNDNEENVIEFKRLDNYMIPFVLRYFLGEEIKESDRVFYHEGMLAKFLDEPKIKI